LLRSGSRPVSVENDTLVLAFGFEIHKQNLEKPENMRIVEKIISDYLGHPCKIHCVVDNKKNHLVDKIKKMGIGAQVISTEDK
jgi:hypothetical protein